MSDIYLSLAETPAVVTLSQPVVSGVLSSTVTVGNTVTVALDANSLSALENVTVTVGAAVSVSNFPASQVVTGSVAVTTMPAISISSVSISNFPSTQTIAGTVTANAIGYNYQEDAPTQIPIRFDGSDTNFVAIGPSIDPIPLPISGAVTANGGDGTFLVGGLRSGSKTALSLDVGTGYLQTKVESLPSISGTVTIGVVSQGAFGATINGYTTDTGGQLFQNCVPVKLFHGSDARLGSVTVGNSVTIGSLPAISGTVTVSNATTASAVAVRLIAEDTNPGGSGAGVNVNLYSNDNALLVDALKNGNSVLGYDGLSSYVQVKPAVGSSVTIGSLPAISGTVTVGAMPSGSLTTRFGTPTTANTAFATAAVTKSDRKYLLIQNVTTGSNVITVGIGFTPTTTQGIQLTAGAGITFESSYIPTGAVYVLSSVTASNFTILEA